MKTILLVESDEEKIWKIIEKVYIYNKYIEKLNIASNEFIARNCISLYEFDIIIVDSNCKSILDYIQENYELNPERIILIINEFENNDINNKFSFKNKVTDLKKLDKELKNIFR